MWKAEDPPHFCGPVLCHMYVLQSPNIFPTLIILSVSNSWLIFLRHLRHLLLWPFHLPFILLRTLFLSPHSKFTQIFTKMSSQ